MKRFPRLADRRVFLFCVALVPVSACASTGATLGSGVGDRLLTRPPYYAGSGIAGSGPVTVVHLPVTYQRGANQEATFDPPASGAMARLLSDLNGALDALDASSPVEAPPAEPGLVPPDVQFNCWTDGGFPDDECAVSGDTALGRSRQTMRLAVGRPSPEWTERMAASLARHGADAVLVITLEIGSYFVGQRGVAGAKEVELGTDHVVSLPWITSLETPVSVIQLTGVLVDATGRARRIGAEGLLARRTPMHVSSVDAQTLITEEDVIALAAARRDDLPGRPGVVEVGLRNLVEGLLAGG